MIDRRSFLGSLSASLAVSHRAQAQQGAKVYRVGWLQPSRPASAGFANFLQVMREFGYVERHNVIYEARFAEGQFQRLPALAADLVRVRVDIIIAVATGAISAAKEATNDIPIVMAFSGIDPVEAGFVSTLGRPGGNVTGLTMLAPELSAKRADIVKQMLPGITRLGVLGYRPNPGTMAQVKAVEQAATRLGMTVHVSAVEEPGRYGDAFAIFAGRQVGAVLVLTDTVLASDRERIVDEGLKHRLATFFDFRESTEAGGFVSYGVSNLGLYRQAARFADRILKGAKPADLPIEQPTKFELVINLRTAKALSLTIPPSLLLRADYIIE